MEYDWIIDGGYLPHGVLKFAIRQVLKARQTELTRKSSTDAFVEKSKYIAKLRQLPIAIDTKAANQQQYEVRTGIFEAFLGPRMKYSCCLFSRGNETLAEDETAMLKEYILKADLKDGMTILDLGCGWGSSTLYFAEQLPSARIVGFSNSSTQRVHVEAEAVRKNLSNIEIVTGDIAYHEFEPGQFDRVVSIELFEHMKNYELLMAKISTSLKPGGKLFVHLFCHRSTPYDFDEGWMSRYFFTGGTMPSADLLLYFQRDLQLQKQWWISGTHYSRTLQAWLSNFMRNKEQVWPYLIETYGENDVAVWYNRWVFYHMAGSEFFGSEGGEENGVCHYLFEKPHNP